MDQISVIIPAFNMIQFLPIAITSIMKQSIKVDEIIIIDPGSIDNTEEIVNDLIKVKYPIKYIKTKECSPSKARNIALKIAKGNIIAFIDADDVWPIDKLANQYTYLKEHPEIDMVSGFVRYFENLDPISLTPTVGSRTRTQMNVNVGACLYRKKVFDKIGLFDESLHYCEDVDLLQRVREYGIPFIILRSVTLYYRRHMKSMIMQEDPRKAKDYGRLGILSKERREKYKLIDHPLDFKSFLEPLK